MPDRLGAYGNGDAWFAPLDADITNHPLYQAYNKTVLASLDPADIKTLMGGMAPTVETAPILNYLRWVLAMRVSLE
jgi:hypothetical protein